MKRIARFLTKNWKVTVPVIIVLAIIGSIGEEPTEKKADTEKPVEMESIKEEPKEETKELFDVRELSEKTQEEINEIVGVESTVDAEGRYMYDLEDYIVSIQSETLEMKVEITPKGNMDAEKDYKKMLTEFGLPTGISKGGELNSNRVWERIDGTYEVRLFSDRLQEKGGNISYLLVNLPN